MSTEVRWRRGTAAQTSAFTGALAEVTVNTDKKALHVHDGSTAGGNRTLMLNELGAASGVADLDSSGQVPVSRLGNVAIKSYATRSALMAGIVALAAGTVVFLTEGSRAGTFIVRDGNYSTQVTADTQQGVFLPTTSDPTGATRVAIRQGASRVAPEWFGAAGDNTTNDTAAVQAALNVAPYTTLFNQRVAITQQYLCDSLTIPDGVVMEGNNPALGDLVPGTSPYSFLSQIRLRAGATINLQRSSVVQRMVIVRDGLLASVTTDADATTIISQFAGTAVSMPYRDAEARDLLILGFDRGIQAIANNNGEGRPVIENVRADCLNPFTVSNWLDMPRIRGCHAWPFLTAHVIGLSNPNLCRSGAGYTFGGRNDWMTVLDCFSYGHKYGFRVQSDSSNITLLRCQADHIGTIGYTTAGFSIEGTANSINLLACTAISHYVGVTASSTSTTPNAVSDCVFANQDACVDHLAGYLTVDNCKYLSGAYGIRTSASITGGRFDRNYFTNVTTAPFNINATTAGSVRIDGRSPKLTYAGVVSATSGTITTATSTIDYYAYESAGVKWVRAYVNVAITTNGTGAGTLQVALPFNSNARCTFSGSREGVGGDSVSMKVNQGSGVLSIVKYDNSYPGADGVTIVGTIDIPVT